jgi:hypothetical protein
MFNWVSGELLSKITGSASVKKVFVPASLEGFVVAPEAGSILAESGKAGIGVVISFVLPGSVQVPIARAAVSRTKHCNKFLILIMFPPCWAVILARVSRYRFSNTFFVTFPMFFNRPQPLA